MIDFKNGNVIKLKKQILISGVLDMDSELILHFSSIGEIKFEFTGSSDIILIGKAIGEYML